MGKWENVSGFDSVFRDRVDAGRQLAGKLTHYAGRSDALVLGIPRGGVVIAFEIASVLRAPLDVFVSRKLGVPWQEELAFGAVASGGVRILEPETVESLGISDAEIQRVSTACMAEVERRERIYRGDRAPLDLVGKTVILVDDGIATGASIGAAIRALRQRRPSRLIVAVPVAPFETCRRLEREVDELVCLRLPETFAGVGQFYRDFSQTTDAEVMDLLDRARSRMRERD